MAKKILIVDDDEDIVFVLGERLRQEGYEVLSAADGEQALNQIQKNTPDVVVLDLMLPKVDGNTVRLKMKDNPETANIPVIIITGKIQLKELLALGEDMSIAAYLEKPFTVNALLEKIRQITA